MISHQIHKSILLLSLFALTYINIFDYISSTFYLNSLDQTIDQNLYDIAAKYSRILLMMLWSATLLNFRLLFNCTIARILLIYASMVLAHSIFAQMIINPVLYTAVYSFLGFSFFFYTSRRRILKTSHLTYYCYVNIVLLLPSVIIDILHFKNVSNQGYDILHLLPYIYLAKPHKLSPLLLMMITAGVFLSMKRGAILAICISIIYIIYHFFKNGKLSTVYKKISLLYGLLTISFCLAFIFGDKLILRFSDIGTDNAGSGRLFLWQLLLDNWVNAEISDKLFGFGVQATNNYLGQVYANFYSHSDWLEMLYNYGIIGFLLFIWLIICFIRVLQYNINNNALILPMALFLITFLFKAIYSGSMMHNSFLYQIIPVSIVQGFSIYRPNKQWRHNYAHASATPPLLPNNLYYPRSRK